ncbi:MAG: glycosyltransferase family 2 protein [Dysgonomonas sp.]
MMPQVSVILPSYNHAPFLEERINSILNQTFQDFELIILDDNSPDNSREIIEQYRDNPHVSHIVFNEKNTGSTFVQWERGIELSTGKYIWIAESDDSAAPELLQTLFDNLLNNDAVLSYCQSHKINKNGEIIGDWEDYSKAYEPELFSQDFVMEGKTFLERCYLIKNFIPNASAVLFSKEAYLKTGGANPRVGYITDWLCWQKILTTGRVAYSHKKLNFYRSHDKSLVTKLWNDPKKLIHKKPHIEMRIAFNDFIKGQDGFKEIYRQNNRRLAKNMLEEAHFLFSNRKFAEGTRYGFSSLKYILKTI